MHRTATILAGLLSLAAPAAHPQTADTGYGPNPKLPPPDEDLLPTVNIAPATGWPEGQKPHAAQGFEVEAFASGLDHPRWIYVLPNGDVLVAETNRPPKEAEGLKSWAMQQVQKVAGAGVPSANRITLLRDADGDGSPEKRSVFLRNLFSPFGMALVGSEFYVANADAVVRFPYEEGQTEITAPGTKLADLPAGPINHHWTKSLVARSDGSKLYVGVGSNSNIAENGIEAEERRAAILEIDRATGRSRVFASGLRNPVGMDWQPQSGALWVAVNERDELGDDLVPDYMTSVQEGGFYGWPYSYFGQHVDQRVQPQRPDLVAQALRRRLRAGRPHRLARPRLLRRHSFPRALQGWRLHRSAWLLEPLGTQRLQGDLRAVRGRPSGRTAREYPDGLPERGWRRAGPPRRRGYRPVRGLAGRRRCRERRLASDARLGDGKRRGGNGAGLSDCPWPTVLYQPS